MRNYLIECEGPAVVIVLEFERRVDVRTPANEEHWAKLKAWIDSEPRRKALPRHAARVALETHPGDGAPSAEDLRDWLDL